MLERKNPLTKSTLARFWAQFGALCELVAEDVDAIFDFNWRVTATCVWPASSYDVLESAVGEI
jgi:hypothetical protein